MQVPFLRLILGDNEWESGFWGLGQARDKQTNNTLHL